MKSVILDLGNIRIAVRKSNFEKVEYNWNGSVHSFIRNKKKYIRSIRNNQFFGFLEDANYSRLLIKYNKTRSVTATEWRIGEFKDFNSLAQAQSGDFLEGAYPDYSSDGKCKQLYLYPYTGSIPAKFYSPEYKDPNSAPFECENFGGSSTPAGVFFNQLKDINFISLESGIIAKEPELIAEIASILKDAGEETAAAFQNFVLSGSTTELFTFKKSAGNFTKENLIEYKNGLLVWLRLLRNYKAQISKLSDNDKLFVYIDVLYRHNMLSFLTIDQKIGILRSIAEGNLSNWYFSSFKTGFIHRESLAVSLIKSITNNEAPYFLDKVVSIKIYDSHIAPGRSLYNVLFFKIDDTWGEDSFTAFATELNRLALAKNGITKTETGLIVNTPQELKELVKFEFIYNKKYNKDFKGEIEYSISYPDANTLKIREKTCIEIDYTGVGNTEYDAQFGGKPYGSKFLTYEKSLNHFDLVSVSFLTNPSFLDLCQYGDCSNSHFLASAAYLDYLLEKEETQLNFALISSTAQLLSLAFGIGELLVAIRSANIVRGAIGLWVVAGDIYAATIDSPSFNEYLEEAYPDDWGDIKNTLNMISILNAVTSGSVSGIYSAYNIQKASAFVGYVEGLGANESAMRVLTSAEVNALQRTRQRLLAEMYILRKNSTTNNIIENTIRTFRDKLNLGIVNSRRGSSLEYTFANTTIKQHRTNTGNLFGGNYSYLELNGTKFENKIWRSGDVLPEEPQIFTAIEAPGASGNVWLRNTDGEFKMLNKFASLYHSGPAGNTSYPNITGTLKIVSESTYCISCSGVIQQFNSMFPNIDLILIDNIKRIP